MSKVNVANVVVLNNPAPFFEPFKFEITFECYETIKDDLEFKLLYVGSSANKEYDQELDSVLVGPVLPEGRHMFVFEVNAPDPSKIPPAEAADVTVILLTCSFKSQEFINIGYFVSNEYTDAELKENPPAEPIFEKLVRNIDVQNPRVTKFPIKWDPDQQNDAAPVAGDDENEQGHVIGQEDHVMNGQEEEEAGGHVIDNDSQEQAMVEAENGLENLQFKSATAENDVTCPTVA